MTGLLIEHLPVVASAPNGVKKLRELILQLAVMGKLLPQDSSDEAASELHRRCLSVREKLGKVKGQRFQPAGNITGPFELPPNWKWVAVGEICHDWGQKTPVDVFTYIDVSAIDNLNGIVKDPKVMPGSDAPSRARKLVRPGTVIYSTVRPYLLNVAIIQEGILPEPIASTAFAVVHPLCDISSRYLFWFFRSPVFTSYVESVQIGVAYPAINDRQFFSGLLPLPPVAEQYRIVAKVDELMALCDRLDAQQSDASVAHVLLVKALLDALAKSKDQDDFATSWERIKQNFDTIFTTESSIDVLKQTLLQLAVMGQLVTDGVSSELSWRTVALESVSEVIDPQPSHRTPPESAAGVPYVGIGDVARNGTINFEGTRKVAWSVYEEHLQRYKLSEGDLIFGKIGTLGKVTKLPMGIKFTLSANVILVQPNKSLVVPGFISLLLESPSFMAEVNSQSVATSQSAFGIKKLRKMLIPLPSLAEQHRIVAKVDELMAICDSLKTSLSRARAHQELLSTVIVEHATNCDMQPGLGRVAALVV